MISATLPDRLGVKVREIEERLERDGVSLRSMKRAGSLELNTTVRQSPIDEPDPLFLLDHLEGVHEIAPRAISRIAPKATGFRYFLDGTQKTLPVWRVGVVPIVVTSIAVGILERGDNGEPLLLPESLAFERVWLIPRGSRVPQIDALIASLELSGEDVRDPFDHRADRDSLDLDAILGQFNRLIGYTYAAANAQRQDMEREALRNWQANGLRRYPDDWIVVDGRLHGDHPRAIGLVKSLQTQILRGQDAVTLFDLKQAHRTTAFRFRPRRSGDERAERPAPNTQWYVRLWDADGFDANHGLVRIEAPPTLSEPEPIDEITAWLLAESLPRATDDARWPSLLYPIHILEKILKRRLAASTTGWPA